jgi:hypothetical protein
MPEVWSGSTVTHVLNQQAPKGGVIDSIKLKFMKSRMDDFVQVFGLTINDHLHPVSHCTAFLNPFPGF